MHPTPKLYALGTCLLAGTMAASAAVPSWFEAHTTGATALTLRGSAEFGSVTVGGGAGPFVLTLGAQSPAGAVVFTRPGGGRLGPGTYRVTEDSAGAVHALVVTGSPTRPTGAFRARGGTLTITRSRRDVIAGRFQMEAVGFEAADPADEDRMLSVRGSFIATPTE